MGPATVDPPAVGDPAGGIDAVRLAYLRCAHAPTPALPVECPRLKLGGYQMERWEKLPEAVRWILYVPVVVVLPAIIGLILHLILASSMPGWRWFRPIANFWVAVFGAYLMVQAFFPIVFLFAPRGKKIAGWCFYVLLMLFTALAFVLLLARRLGTWGLLGDAL